MENLCYVRDDQSPVDKEYSEREEFASTHFSYGGLLSVIGYFLGWNLYHMFIC